ncbi:hypothetical protein SAMN06265795_11452 [Noviherbaspirillum humi]|uniref:Uncharacterized protein n=1 Tax=Noviherbaspirillum humi TaxID=1688639 RepID=A0A239JZN8_9BURK|nr:hypothetical protein [Noviherbaspirillum humi]SNT11089.1 hypothetical protein SAMN06265795_11452 [Noviherbaspirillum humi]
MSFVSASPNTTPAISSPSTLPSTSLPSPSPSQTVAFVDETAELARTGAWLLQTMVGLGLAVGGLFAYLANRFKQKPPRTLDDFNRTVLQGDPSKLPERVDKLVAKLSVNPVIKRNVATLGEQFKQALNTGDQAKAKEILSVLCVLETGKVPDTVNQAILERLLHQIVHEPNNSGPQCELKGETILENPNAFQFRITLTAKRDGKRDEKVRAVLKLDSSVGVYDRPDGQRPYSATNRREINHFTNSLLVDGNPVVRTLDWVRTDYFDQKTFSNHFAHYQSVATGTCFFPEGKMDSTPRSLSITWPPVPKDKKN